MALNAGEIDDADLDDGLPNIARAVYPIGALTWTYQVGSNAPAQVGYAQQIEITARSGRAEATDVFSGIGTRGSPPSCSPREGSGTGHCPFFP